MQIKLENIGIVKNSSIELNGLTVITGKNNSGKSTVGKTLYALLDAVSNISEKYEKDRCNFINEYSRAAEPPVQCGVSHLSRRTEPHCL